MAILYAKLLNQYKFKYHIFFSDSFYKINKEDQRSEEIEFCINLNINILLTETDFDYIDIKSQLEYQIQIQETKESGWILIKLT